MKKIIKLFLIATLLTTKLSAQDIYQTSDGINWYKVDPEIKTSTKIVYGLKNYSLNFREIDSLLKNDSVEIKDFDQNYTLKKYGFYIQTESKKVFLKRNESGHLSKSPATIGKELYFALNNLCFIISIVLFIIFIPKTKNGDVRYILSLVLSFWILVFAFGLSILYFYVNIGILIYDVAGIIFLLIHTLLKGKELKNVDFVEKVLKKSMIIGYILYLFQFLFLI